MILMTLNEIIEIDMARVSDSAGHMAPRSALLFLLLWKNKNRTFTIGQIEENWFNLTAQRTTHESIKTGIKNLRKDLAREGWPIEIETKYGIGYKMTLNDPKWTWESILDDKN